MAARCFAGHGTVKISKKRSFEALSRLSPAFGILRNVKRQDPEGGHPEELALAQADHGIVAESISWLRLSAFRARE